MFNKKVILGVAMALAFALVAYYGGKRLKLQKVLAAAKTPYVVRFQEIGYLTNADGSIKDEGAPLAPGPTYFLKARQSDGSTVDLGYERGRPASVSNVIWRRVASVSQRRLASVFSQSNAKTSLPMLDGDAADLKAGPADPSCRTHPERKSGSVILGTDTFLGVQVVKHRFSPAGGTTILELWEAPALDCEIVYGKTYFRGKSGEIDSVTIKSATSIELNEPEAWLFDITSGIEMKPSEAMAAELHRTSGDPSKLLPKALSTKLQQKDNVYNERWKSAH